MAQTSINQLHPGVYGTISSQESTYSTASGVLTMFQADVFEKGPDNQLGFVTSVEEFISKYGSPNFSKYGQAAYNIVNFLEAGGQAYVMRVLPENATYSHAILNVQTKVNSAGKSVKTDAGNIVKVDDVSIRPTTAFSSLRSFLSSLLRTSRDRLFFWINAVVGLIETSSTLTMLPASVLTDLPAELTLVWTFKIAWE